MKKLYKNYIHVCGCRINTLHTAYIIIECVHKSQKFTDVPLSFGKFMNMFSVTDTHISVLIGDKQVQALNMSLSDSVTTIANLQDRVGQMQRALASSEQDRRVLQERLDNTR